MKIGLLFGSFNPIHTGHLIIANYIASYYVEKVWFIVSPQNPFKSSGELLDFNARLELVKLAIQNDNRFEVSDIEFKLPLPSYTINTLQEIGQAYSQNEFYLIIGSDNFASFSEWKSSNQIMQNYNLLIYERPGFTIKDQNVTHNIQILKAPLLDISSTTIRSMIREKKSIRYLIPEKVYSEIMINGYFK